MEKVANRMAKREKRREYHQYPRVVDVGVPCPHCKARFGHRITHTLGNGKRRRICRKCGKPFIAVETCENQD
jgi:hypothetical protein